MHLTHLKLILFLTFPLVCTIIFFILVKRKYSKEPLLYKLMGLKLAIFIGLMIAALCSFFCK
jgi:hypothetical protein